MLPEVWGWIRRERMKRSAFVRNFDGGKSGLPNGELPECERGLINVIGFHSHRTTTKPYLRSAWMPPDLQPSQSPTGSTSALLEAGRGAAL